VLKEELRFYKVQKRRVEVLQSGKRGELRFYKVEKLES